MTDPKITAELKRLADQNGGLLMPEAVVNAARDAASILHSHFEWDDSAAAEKYRIQQARSLIRVVVSYLGPNRDYESRVFVSLADDRKEDGGYREITTVLVDPQQRNELLQTALRELLALQVRYRELKELAEVFEALERVAA